MERVDVPLYVALEWVEAHCVITSGEGVVPFRFTDEQLAFTAGHYLVAAGAKRGMLAPAFLHRRSQLVRAQKWGKSPLQAALVCLEAAGPAVFDGWAVGGEVYACADNGCPCGWEYVFQPEEPLGRRWTVPIIQIVATSEGQTDNVYGLLRDMINLGPLARVLPKTGEDVIRIPDHGEARIEPVSAKARSRLGARVTFAVLDETGVWVGTAGHALATTIRRGLSGTGGRAVETTNAWDPSEDSVAQRTFESTAADVQRDFRSPPVGLSWDDVNERRQIIEWNYAGAPWVDVEAILAEAAELSEKSPAEAERFYGNRLVQGLGAWMPIVKWIARATDEPVPDGTRIVLGFDGSEVDDFTAIVAETLDGHQFVPVYHGGRRTIWDPREWPDGRVPQQEVWAAFEELFERFEVVRAYCDPPFWATLIDELAGRYPKRVFRWETYRPVQMHSALERNRDDVLHEGSAFSHSGDSELESHIRNAVELARRGSRYVLGKASQAQKIDAAMAAVLAHEARADAVAAGREEQISDYVYF